VPVEAFDLTGYCTSADHARLVGKFFLSIRRRVTHSIKFRTTPYGIDLAPGKFIKVITEASPYSAARNGTIGADGTITSVSEITNGTYSIIYYNVDFEDVAEASMTVSEGKVTQTSLWNSVFTIKEITRSENVYMVEQLTINEEGIVEISASEFPCDANLSSVMAKDVLTDSLFVFEN
jgi:predicted phage tail protein